MVGRKLIVGPIVIASLALVVVETASTASAQNVDLPRFDPSAAGDRFFGVPSPYAAGEVTPHGGIVLDYAHNPLVLASADGESAGAVVEHQMFLHANLTLSIVDRVLINVDMPFALVNMGDGVVASNDLAFVSPDGGGFGDLRAGLRVRLHGEYADPFQIGLGGYVWFPTGTDGDYITNASVRGQPQVLLGGLAGRFLWTVMVGATLKSVDSLDDQVSLGHQFVWGAGVGCLLGGARNVQIGVESSGAMTLQDPSKENTNIEALAGIKWRIVRFLEVGGGAGPGFTSGIGTPDVRSVFSLMYTPDVDERPPYVPPKPLDRDKDKIMDDVDACPDERGIAHNDPQKHGCPIRDRDHDGFADDLDACPDEAGVASTDKVKHGCPLRDRDDDMIADDVDTCPDLAGLASEDPKQHGCPADSDGDGFADDVDACPREKGVDDPAPSKRGCPRAVRVTETEIVILEQVQFDTGKATIKSASKALLDAVAQVLDEHPEIELVEIQGHTDNRAAKALNQKLSERRAQSVADALMQRGIERARLVARGYGLDKPVGDNATEEGREKNRRVQFVVLKKGETKKR
ncbi:MAG: OmpA family protein [Polyangiaceae bacterium]|nr:OmpA family protein [Polyangiaceae bacterium]